MTLKALKSFVKDFAMNGNNSNWNSYLIKAKLLIIDEKNLSGEDIASIINSIPNYERFKQIFNSDKELIEKVKKMMKETEYQLINARYIGLEFPKLIDDFNEASKKEFYNNVSVDSNCNKWATLKRINEFLNYNDKIWTISNNTNLFHGITDYCDFKKIQIVIRHKRFKYFNSQYALRHLLVSNKIDNAKDFEIVIKQLMSIINNSNGWNTDFSTELTFLINNRFFKPEYLNIFSGNQQKAMLKYADDLPEDEINGFDESLKKYLYEKSGNEKFLGKDVKDIFVF